MTEIYVVMSQGNPMLEEGRKPVAAYSDYPSALAYAQTIFVSLFGIEGSARDLVYLVNLSPTPVVSAPTPTTT